jgi:hypothetical protein
VKKRREKKRKNNNVPDAFVKVQVAAWQVHRFASKNLYTLENQICQLEKCQCTLQGKKAESIFKHLLR